MKNSKAKLLTITIIVSCVLLFSVNITLGIVLMNQSQEALKSIIFQRMLDISNSAAALVDADDLAALTEDTTTDEYKRVYKILRAFQDNIDCDYIYAGKKESEGKYIFILDPSDNPDEYGDEIEYTEAMNNAGNGTPDVDREAVPDEYGVFYSSFSPVFNDDGEVVAIIGVDFRKEWFDEQVAKNTSTELSSDVLSLVIGAIIVLLATYGMRSNSKKLQSELNGLSDKISALNPKKEVQTTIESGETKLASAANAETGQTGDDASVASAKIRNMGRMIDEYTAYVEAMSYTDILTGVRNASAYYKLVDELNVEIMKGKADFGVMVFNLNGLRKINEGCGHAVGDKFIVDGVKIMSSVVGKDNLYRVGGDEFIAVLFPADQEKITKISDRLNEECDNYNLRHADFSIPVTFAKGASVYSRGDAHFKDVFLRAERAMITDKKNMN